jgi:hypothetical protein
VSGAVTSELTEKDCVWEAVAGEWIDGVTDSLCALIYHLPRAKILGHFWHERQAVECALVIKCGKDLCCGLDLHNIAMTYVLIWHARRLLCCVVRRGSGPRAYETNKFRDRLAVGHNPKLRPS